jgi:hypothetical protein
LNYYEILENFDVFSTIRAKASGWLEEAQISAS